RMKKKLEAELPRDACNNKMWSKVCLGGQGQHCSFPNEDAVVQWIKQMRLDDLRAILLYFLYRLLQRLVHRWGFAFRKPNRTVIASIDLEREQQAFASSTGAAIRAAYSRSCIWNTDEIAVYYDEEPGTVIAESGSKKPAMVLGRKRSQRASVRLTVSASGKKMKPLVIFNGQPGGVVEKKPHDSRVAVAVQTNGWMDARVWREYIIDGVCGEFVSTEYPEAPTLYVDVTCQMNRSRASWTGGQRWPRFLKVRQGFCSL
ncbi:hypothetical protein PHMEG_00031322, partial [Phytophthora megakarya]